jgi:DNA-binding GntR family transcriptional regulator
LALVEKNLPSRLTISKTPIREAIASLEGDGSVDFAPYRGATVRWLSTDEMSEQRFLVDGIELPALGLVVERITQAELANLAKVLQQMKRARAARWEAVPSTDR